LFSLSTLISTLLGLEHGFPTDNSDTSSLGHAEKSSFITSDGTLSEIYDILNSTEKVGTNIFPPY
jgi:hypothetical protein